MTISVFTLVFILIGDMNRLATLATMPFLITYGAIEYSYFALSQQFEMNQKRLQSFKGQGSQSPTFEQSNQQQIKVCISKEGSRMGRDMMLDHVSINGSDERTQHAAEVPCHDVFTELHGLFDFLGSALLILTGRLVLISVIRTTKFSAAYVTGPFFLATMNDEVPFKSRLIVEYFRAFVTTKLVATY